MTFKTDIPIRTMAEQNYINWLHNPCAFFYIREANYICCNKKYIPLKRKSDKLLIGYGIKEKTGRVYQGIFYYLKPHDIGMPKEKDGYLNSNFTPNEAVRFIE